MDLTGISVLYFVCVAFGFVFALVTAVFGELGGHVHIGHIGHIGHVGSDIGGHSGEVGVGHDADAGVTHAGGVAHHPGGAVVGVGDEQQFPQSSVFNTLTILVFIAFFGLAGLFSTWVLKASPVVSLAFALPVALFAALGEFVLYVKVFIKAQGSSEATMNDILGCEAEVITSIPAERVGEIAYVIKGSRYNGPAVSADKEDLTRGTKVQVVNTRAGKWVVRAV
jgi:hypothetical protein